MELKESEMTELLRWLNDPAYEIFEKYMESLILNLKNAIFYLEEDDPIKEMKAKALLKGQANGINRIYKLKKDIESKLSKKMKEREEKEEKENG